MPWFDGSGPRGFGSGMGRGFGPCGYGGRRMMNSWRATEKFIDSADRLASLEREEKMLEEELQALREEKKSYETKNK